MIDKSYPETLIPDELTVLQVREQVCEQCVMTHRALKGIPLYIITGVVNADVIDFDRFYGLSVNVLLCDTHPLSANCDKNYVKYGIVGDFKKFAFKPFSSDEKIPDINELEFVYDAEVSIIGFKKSKIESITGFYPFGKNGKHDNELYTFSIEVLYKPTLTNVFHFEVTVKGDHENGTLRPLKGRPSKKKYLDSIVYKIRNRIIRGNFLFEIT